MKKTRWLIRSRLWLDFRWMTCFLNDWSFLQWLSKKNWEGLEGKKVSSDITLMWRLSIHQRIFKISWLPDHQNVNQRTNSLLQKLFSSINMFSAIISICDNLYSFYKNMSLKGREEKNWNARICILKVELVFVSYILGQILIRN